MKRRDILEFLKEAARTGEEIAAFFVGGSLSRFPGVGAGMRSVKAVRDKRWRENFSVERERAKKKRIQRIVESLRADGLIESERRGRSATYNLTRNGADWLDEKCQKGVPGELQRREFKSEPAEVITIIAYDIPNKQRQYRDWLRGQLIELGFNMLQRSVFVGKVKIPEELIQDLEKHHILDFVEIFEITKKGTLRLSKNSSY